MITESQIYWITRLDSINVALEVLSIAFGVVGSLGLIMSIIGYFANKVDEQYEQNAKFIPICKRCIWYSVGVLLLTFICAAGLTFLPTTKEMCAIKIIPVIANNEGVQELPQKAVELANEWMEELKPKKNE